MPQEMFPLLVEWLEWAVLVVREEQVMAAEVAAEQVGS